MKTKPLRLTARLQRWSVLPIVYVALTSIAGAVDLLVPAESFETDGEGARYLSNTHHDSGGTGGDYWERFNFGAQNPHPQQHNPPISGGLDGSFGWAGEDVDTSDNPISGGASGFPGIVRLDDLNVAGFSNLRVTVSLAVSQPVPVTTWPWIAPSKSRRRSTRTAAGSRYRSRA